MVTSTYQERLAEAMQDAGVDVSRLASQLGVSYQAVKKVMDGKTKSLTAANNAAAAQFLSVDPSWLASGRGQKTVLMASAADESHWNGAPETSRSVSRMRKIPVVGTAKLGDDGHFHELEYPVGFGDGYVDMPSADGNAYAVRCRGDSMAPRIKNGEFVVVNPSVEVTPGDEVLVRSKDGRVMVKHFAYRREGRVHLLSVNEAHPTIAIDESDIDAMHYVWAVVKSAAHMLE